MTFREELIQSIKGKPGSLTSQAFNTGVIVERERIVKILEDTLCECRYGYPEELKKYYKTSGNQTRESLWEQQNYESNHQYCNHNLWTLRLILGDDYE